MIIKLPFKQQYRITQTFGADFIYRGKFVKHKGVDWAVPKGTPLLAPFDGVIIRTTPKRSYGYGKAVYILADDKSRGVFQALLAHCEAIEVKVGQSVKLGDKVARSGRSGFWRGKNGYHLHFGLKRNNVYVDPISYLRDLPNYNKEIVDDFVHIVEKGETLWGISYQYYGDGKYYNEIVAANPKIKNPKIIQPGERFIIPKLFDRGV